MEWRPIVEVQYTMRRLVIVFLILVFASLPQVSEAATMVSGVIVDQRDGEPLTGVNVRVSGTHLGDATDLDGQFVISALTPGDYTLEFTHVGYKSSKKQVYLTADGLSDLRIEMVKSTVELDEVVYTATRTLHTLADVPVTTELVSQAEIRQSASFDAAEALASEIGLDVREDFAGQGVMLQGIDPERVLILVDGNRVIGRVNGSIDLSQISTQNIKQIEVVKGAVSTLYGSEAIGGVINVITDRAEQPFKMNVEFSGGGYIPSGTGWKRDFGVLAAGMLSPAVDLEWRLGRVGVTLGSRYQSQGLMDSTPSTDHTEGTPSSDRVSGNLRVDYDWLKTVKAHVRVSGMNEELGWIEESQSIDWRTGQLISFDDKEINKQMDIAAGIDCTPSWAESYKIKAYHTVNHHSWEKYTHSGLLRDYSRSDEQFSQLESQFTFNALKVHRLTVGADAYQWDIQSNSLLGSLVSNLDASLNAWDIYVQDEWLVTKNFTLVPGVRHEVHEIYGINVAPQLSARLALTDHTTLRGSVGRGYRAPSSKELYYDFNHSSAGYVVYGNDKLNPEKSTNVNISLEHVYEDRSSSRITLFYNDLHDLIDFQLIEITEEYDAGIYRYGNIVSAWTRGVELERSMQLAPDLRLTLAYAFLESFNRDVGNQLLRRPKHSGRWVVSWSPGVWNVRVWGRYTSEMLYEYKFDQSAQSSDERTLPYTFWNLAISRKVGNSLSLFLKADNLFDYTNATYGPYRGRVITAGARYALSGDLLGY